MIEPRIFLEILYSHGNRRLNKSQLWKKSSTINSGFPHIYYWHFMLPLSHRGDASQNWPYDPPTVVSKQSFNPVLLPADLSLTLHQLHFYVAFFIFFFFTLLWDSSPHSHLYCDMDPRFVILNPTLALHTTLLTPQPTPVSRVTDHYLPVSLHCGGAHTPSNPSSCCGDISPCCSALPPPDWPASLWIAG